VTTDLKPHTIDELVTTIYEDNFGHFDFIENYEWWRLRLQSTYHYEYNFTILVNKLLGLNAPIAGMAVIYITFTM